MDCPVCYDSLNTNIYFPYECGHKVCLRCNEQMEDRRCPICRADIPILITRNEYLFLCGFITFIISIFYYIII
jgi:hypothetical protein